MGRPNVLFIPIDDLRPQLGCYGHGQMKTPHLDGLADSGTVFKQAYCQVPVCGASRASLLTGRRPTANRFLDYLARADEDLPEAVTLPQHFKENGYETVAVGKVFHHADDCEQRSWSQPVWEPPGRSRNRWRNYLTPEAIAAAREAGNFGPPFECAEVPDNAYNDGQIADRAIAELSRLRGSDKPFFLAAGFIKPHLPFNAPKRYWDLYRRDDVHMADNPFAPQHAPGRAVHNFSELRAYFDVPKEGPLPPELERDLVHGYYAATSYADAQIGRVLKALRTFGMEENTIVVAWGDHGWQLGEHGMWCKHCNFKTSLNAPLIVRAPDQRGGGIAESIAEFVDIFPTLCDLSGLNAPEALAGISLAPMLEDDRVSVKDAAYSRWWAGESVRTGDVLFTEWYDEEGNATERMLYNHQDDPGENVNVSEEDENAVRIAQCSQMLASIRAQS